MTRRFSAQMAKPDGTIHDLKKRADTMYPYGFDPTFHRYRLTEPRMWKTPLNIFVCSMADLFGDWVPDEWIEGVFKACEAAPWHRYLFLTKDVHAYEDHEVPAAPNYWYGQTWDGVWTGLTNYTEYGINTFVSIEPLLNGNLPTASIADGWFNWVIIGAETGNRKGKVTPKREWLEAIVSACRAVNVPVFMKDSLAAVWGRSLIREFPWE
jgi:protein gp37